MSKFAAKVANALSFAHLAGMGRAKSARAEEEDEDKKDEQDREEGNAKSKRADDDKEKPKDDDNFAEGEDGDEELSAGDDDDSDEDTDKKNKKAKKAKASGDGEDGDEDKDEEMRGNTAAASARRREQARCAAIFASPAAAKNPVLAANLAFKTRTPRHEAVAILEGTPAAANAPDRNRRADRNPNIAGGENNDRSSQQSKQSRWDAAFAKVNPQRRK
jgi:hypothetical protein